MKEYKFPDIPDMRFFETEEKLLYFNATHCIDKHAPTEQKTVSDFMVKFEYVIQTIQQSANLTDDDVAVQDEAGTVYLEESMALPFLWYLEGWFGPYLIDRAEDMLRYGFTINDNMLRFFYHNRFTQ